MIAIWPGGNEEKSNRVNSPDSSAGNPQRSMSQFCKVQRVFPRQGEGVGIAIAARLGPTFGVTRLGVQKVEAEGHGGNDAGGAGNWGLQAQRLQAR